MPMTPSANGRPMITITDATPQRTPDSIPTSSLADAVHTPVGSDKCNSKTTDAYRLLYRGALSLPDSYLLLDGIAFSARLSGRQTVTPSSSAARLQDSPSCASGRDGGAGAKELMYNPLALALESMRGRPALRFKGVVRMDDVWTDDAGEVYMDVHPFATLTRIYFENALCLAPLVAPSADAFGPKRTEVGVRVSLGDADGPETTDIVIYGETSSLPHPPPMQPSPLATTSAPAGLPPLSMRVARITPAPRAPRPDDPTPRRPPARLFGPTLSDLGASKRIVARPTCKDKDEVDDPVVRRAREVMLHLPRSEGSASGRGKGKGKEKDESARNGAFKVPELPVKARRKQGEAGTDVFGAVEPPRPQFADGRGKGKAEDRGTGVTIEKANKSVLKKLTELHLFGAGMSRSHDEFKDVFGFVYRGASFALRSQMKTTHVSPHSAEAVIKAHVKLYVTSGRAHVLAGSEGMLSNTMDVDNAEGHR